MVLYLKFVSQESNTLRTLPVPIKRTLPRILNFSPTLPAIL